MPDPTTLHSCRYAFEASASAITGIMDPLLARYSEGLAFLRGAGAGAANVDAALAALKMLECQLAWLVAVIGAVVGGASASGSSHFSMYFAAFGAGGSGSALGGAGGAGRGGEECADADLSR